MKIILKVDFYKQKSVSGPHRFFSGGGAGGCRVSGDADTIVTV